MKSEVNQKTLQDASDGWFQSYSLRSAACCMVRASEQMGGGEVTTTHSVKCSFSEVLIQWSTHLVKYSYSEVLIQWSTHSVKRGWHPVTINTYVSYEQIRLFRAQPVILVLEPIWDVPYERRGASLQTRASSYSHMGNQNNTISRKLSIFSILLMEH